MSAASCRTADEITDLLAATILDDLPVPPRQTVSIVMVNGMGGTPLVELYIVFRRLAERLRRTRTSRSPAT